MNRAANNATNFLLLKVPNYFRPLLVCSTAPVRTHRRGFLIRGLHLGREAAPGRARSPGPNVYPSSTGSRRLNTFLTVSLQVLSNGPVRGTYHLLRGRMFLSFPAAVYNIYPYGSPAPFSCSPPVLSPQDRSGVTAANFHIILCEPSCPVGGLPPSFVAFLVWVIFEREAIRS
jgi:hypothetical protein